jgi:hypothetical protein
VLLRMVTALPVDLAGNSEPGAQALPAVEADLGPIANGQVNLRVKLFFLPSFSSSSRRQQAL